MRLKSIFFVRERIRCVLYWLSKYCAFLLRGFSIFDRNNIGRKRIEPSAFILIIFR